MLVLALVFGIPGQQPLSVLLSLTTSGKHLDVFESSILSRGCLPIFCTASTVPTFLNAQEQLLEPPAACLRKARRVSFPLRTKVGWNIRQGHGKMIFSFILLIQSVHVEQDIPIIAGSVSHASCTPYNGKFFCATSLKADGRYATWDYCDITQNCPNEGKY